MMRGLEAIAQNLSGRALNTAIEGVLLATALWVLLRVYGRQSSRTRFAIWFVALLAIAALPFLTVPHIGSTGSMGFSHFDVTLPASWALYLFLAWAAGALLSLTRLGTGLWRVHQLRRNCVELDPASLDPMIAARLQEHGARRRVSLCISDELTVPTAIGFFRPAVVFPASLVSQLAVEEMEVILLHELAHLSRWDDWSNLVQKLVKAAFFFHPAVWWIERRLTLEREMACDEIVVAEIRSPRTYASLLISLTEKVRSAGSLALVHGLVNRVCQLSLRIVEILDTNDLTRRTWRKPLLGVSAGLFAAVFGVTAYAPQFVSFQRRPEIGQASTMSESSVRPATQTLNSTHAPRVIPAVFHSTPTIAPSRSAETATRKPKVHRAKVMRKQFSAAPMFVILRQAEYDVSGSAVWSICVWKFEPGGSETLELQSAIVMKI